MATSITLDRTNAAARSEERSTVGKAALHRIAAYLPGLHHIYHGYERINVFQLAQKARLVQAGPAYRWMAGTQIPDGLHLSYLVHEVLSVAEYERLELQKAKEKLERCTCQS